MAQTLSARSVCPVGFLFLSAASVLAALALSGCYPSEPAPFNPHDLERLEAAYAQENGAADLQPLPLRSIPPVLPSTREALAPSTQAYLTPTTLPMAQPSNSKRLSLQQLIHLATVHSLDVRVAGYQPAIDATRVNEASAAFDPTFFQKFNYTHQSTVQPSLSNPTVNPLLAPVRFDQYTSSTGLKQTLDSGAQAQIHYDINRSDEIQLPTAGGTTTAGSRFFTNELTFEITQPLLQNFGAAANYARIAIARNTQVSSLLDFRLALEKNMADIENAYWQLVQAERVLKIRQDLLERTKDNAKLMQLRMGQDATELEVEQANAAVAARAADLVSARQAIIDLSNKLKSLVNDPDLPVSGSLLLLPLDQPVETAVKFDEGEMIKTALANRAEMAQQRTKINSADATMKAAWNNLLPQLNLTGSVGSQADGRTLSDAFAAQDTWNMFDWAVGIELDIPIGNQEARAIYRRTWLQRQQSIDQYRSIVEQITLDVRTAYNQYATSWEQIKASRDARFHAEKELGILDQRINTKAVTLSPPLVQTRLQFQSDLATAEANEIAAITNYNIAISALERAKGTILRYNNVTMEEQVSSMPGR